MCPPKFGDESDDCRDGYDLRSPESLQAVFTRSPDHLEWISYAHKECITDRPTDNGPTDQKMNRPSASYRDARMHLIIFPPPFRLDYHLFPNS